MKNNYNSYSIKSGMNRKINGSLKAQTKHWRIYRFILFKINFQRVARRQVQTSASSNNQFDELSSKNNN